MAGWQNSGNDPTVCARVVGSIFITKSNANVHPKKRKEMKLAACQVPHKLFLHMPGAEGGERKRAFCTNNKI